MCQFYSQCHLVLEFLITGQDIDSVSLPRTTDTIIIDESIEAEDNLIRVGFLSFPPPEIDFPANLQAIKEYGRVSTGKRAKSSEAKTGVNDSYFVKD